MTEDDCETEEVTGYMATRVDCPCGYVNYFEGDVRGETLKCDDCEILLEITQIV